MAIHSSKQVVAQIRTILNLLIHVWSIVFLRISTHKLRYITSWSYLLLVIWYFADFCSLLTTNKSASTPYTIPIFPSVPLIGVGLAFAASGLNWQLSQCRERWFPKIDDVCAFPILFLINRKRNKNIATSIFASLMGDVLFYLWGTDYIYIYRVCYSIILILILSTIDSNVLGPR